MPIKELLVVYAEIQNKKQDQTVFLVLHPDKRNYINQRLKVLSLSTIGSIIRLVNSIRLVDSIIRLVGRNVEFARGWARDVPVLLHCEVLPAQGSRES